MNKEVKRVAVIVHSLRGGGAERVAANLMNELAKTYTVYAVMLEDPSQEDYELSDKVGRHLFKKGKSRSRLDNYRRMLRMMHDIRSFRRKNKVDVCISFLEQGNLLNIGSSGLGCGRSYVSIRNLSSYKVKAVAMGRSAVRSKRLDRFAKGIVCVTEDVAEDIIACYGIPRRKIKVIYNWVEPEKLQMLASDEPDDEFKAFRKAHAMLFVNSGRLNIQKGQWHLIRAFARLHKEHPEAGLCILGKGSGNDMEEKLLEERRVCGMDQHVLLCGRRDNPFSYVARSDVFVFSSIYEGCPNAVLEAMALGLPVIADDCAGTRELLTPSRTYGQSVSEICDGEYGLVTPALGFDWNTGDDLTEEEQVLYLAMKRMAESSADRQYYGAKSLERASQFSKKEILPGWISLIKG